MIDKIDRSEVEENGREVACYYFNLKFITTSFQ